MYSYSSKTDDFSAQTVTNAPIVFVLGVWFFLEATTRLSETSFLRSVQSPETVVDYPFDTWRLVLRHTTTREVYYSRVTVGWWGSLVGGGYRMATDKIALAGGRSDRPDSEEFRKYMLATG